MANADETVREVCADAKNTSTNWIRTMNVLGVMPTRECIHRWCDRILAAHERELAAKDAEIAQLVTKCNRLKAALLTICTADKTAEGLREIAIDACNGKEVK